MSVDIDMFRRYFDVKFDICGLVKLSLDNCAILSLEKFEF